MPSAPGKLLDPFSGVGTIPFEARLSGHVAYGFEISPAALIISRAKLEAVAADAVRKELEGLTDWVENYPAEQAQNSDFETI